MADNDVSAIILGTKSEKKESLHQSYQAKKLPEMSEVGGFKYFRFLQRDYRKITTHLKNSIDSFKNMSRIILNLNYFYLMLSKA
jgi:hypothetical protein